MAEKAEEQLEMELGDSEDVEINPYEEQAKAKGWRPKDDFDGDTSQWVDAEEFVKREPLFDKIRNQSKELKDMRKTLDAMSNHFHKATKVAVDKAISDLKGQRKEAIELGDVNRVDQIDQEIKQQESQAPKPQGPPAVPDEIKDWIDVNPWFNSNKEMQAFAIAFNEQYLKSNPGDLPESLRKTKDAVKRAFPETFQNDNRSDPPKVESGSAPKGKTAGGYSVSKLSAEQKMVYNQMVKTHKVLSHDEYFKSLEDIGEYNG